MGNLQPSESTDLAGRLGLLASAISSRALRVVSGTPGEPTWTDGSVVFVDAGIDEDHPPVGPRRLAGLTRRHLQAAAGDR
jgi:hypothetical protein